MLRLPLLGLGAALACLLAVLLPPTLLLWLGGCFLLAFFVLRLARKKARHLGLLLLGLSLGFLLFAFQFYCVYQPAQTLAGKTLRLEGTVLQYPEEDAHAKTVLLRAGEEGSTARYLLRLRMEENSPALRPGDRIRTVAYCSALPLSGEAWARAQAARGIFLGARGYGPLGHERPAMPALNHLPALVGEKLRGAVRALYDERSRPFLLSLLTGDQGELGPELRADLQRSGLSHVVAISGMHISFLAGLLSLLPSRSRWTPALQIPLLFFFALLSGGTAGALRAAFLCSFGLLAPLLGRRRAALPGLFAALLLLLVQNPFAIMGLGLQFSFAACLGIEFLGKPLARAWLERLPRLGLAARGKRAALSLLAISLGSCLFTLPLSALYFGQVSLIAPLSNLASNALVSALFCLGLLSLFAFLLFPPLGALLAALAQPLALCFLWLSKVFAGPSFAALPTCSFYYSLLFVGLYLLALALLFAWQRKLPLRPLFPLCAMLVLFCVSLPLESLSHASRALSLTLLDVGQGQSVLIQAGSYSALLDCGGSKQAGSIAANALQSRGISRLPLLILTHSHADHANGLAQLLSRIRVDCLILPAGLADSEESREIIALAEEQHIELLYLDREASIAFGRAQLRIFPPVSQGDDNERGLSLLCSYADWDALLTGDMSSTTEEKLLAAYPLPPLELLVLGHHGSRYASSPALLAETSPQMAAVSVGRNNYGHPAPDTLARLEQAGIPLYRTDALGSITIFATETED